MTTIRIALLAVVVSVLGTAQEQQISNGVAHQTLLLGSGSQYHDALPTPTTPTVTRQGPNDAGQTWTYVLSCYDTVDFSLASPSAAQSVTAAFSGISNLIGTAAIPGYPTASCDIYLTGIGAGGTLGYLTTVSPGDSFTDTTGTGDGTYPPISNTSGFLLVQGLITDLTGGSLRLGNASAATGSLGIGFGGTVATNGSVAVGIGAVAKGSTSFVEGTQSNITGANGIGLGHFVNDAGFDDVIISGNQTTATSASQVIFGGNRATVGTCVAACKDVYFGDPSYPAAGETKLNSSASTGTNISGSRMTVASGPGTGNAAGSIISFKTPTVGSTGTAPQTLAERAQVNATGFQALTYQTTTNCANAASPAVCGAASAGAVAIPTGVTSVSLTVNTTAVTASSRIFLASDDSVTIAATTCNNTLATLVGGLAITGRVAGTSFTVTYNGTIAANPLCMTYFIVD